MSLARLQQQFLSAVLGEGDAAPADPRGMRVYANNYRGQLAGSLRDTFERVERWLGEEAFEGHVAAYVEAHPSSSWNLNGYGEDFPAFLVHAVPLPDPAAEIAWLDHALRNAFYCRDVTPAVLQELTVSDWERATFSFVPSLGFRWVHTNAPSIWAALSSSSAMPATTLLPDPVAVRVWRQQLTPRFTSMPPWETDCLDLAMAGGTFGELCALLERLRPDADIATVAGQLLREWFEDGLVADVG
ncbi:DNA-binding domain-containing protein [Luteibacter aegosomaticola]|uniref:HvfC/BufC N-terminal domain-containing protein n=1 Tax=Luteibacter aegosomaticola TaxID=2911538 RepID=UPI001FFB6043|nr:DNA-binding domain-containing protein [Luteibacter aegosomaticola]UPG90218.1 DNA-binding domain-containing protein [Luteibacter aegosomaticola]